MDIINRYLQKGLTNIVAKTLVKEGFNQTLTLFALNTESYFKHRCKYFFSAMYEKTFFSPCIFFFATFQYLNGLRRFMMKHLSFILNFRGKNYLTLDLARRKSFEANKVKLYQCSTSRC